MAIRSRWPAPLDDGGGSRASGRRRSSRFLQPVTLNPWREHKNLAEESGATCFFTRAGTTWTAGACVKGSNTEKGDEFGSSLALSGNGRTMVVGAPPRRTAPPKASTAIKPTTRATIPARSTSSRISAQRSQGRGSGFANHLTCAAGQTVHPSTSSSADNSATGRPRRLVHAAEIAEPVGGRARQLVVAFAVHHAPLTDDGTIGGFQRREVVDVSLPRHGFAVTRIGNRGPRAPTSRHRARHRPTVSETASYARLDFVCRRKSHRVGRHPVRHGSTRPPPPTRNRPGGRAAATRDCSRAEGCD